MAKYPHSESSTLELKEKLPQSEQIIETMIGFCNLYGGKLVIGVADDRTIVGLGQNELDKCLQWIEKGVHEACFPPIIPRISTQSIGDKNLLEIEVSAGMSKPYYRRSEGLEKGTYVRLGQNTVRATPEMIEELRWQGSGTRFESLPMYRATLDDLNHKKIQTFLSARKNHGDPAASSKTLQSYGITVSEHAHEYPTVAGMLLFGTKPQNHLPEAMIICSHFRGTAGRDMIATVDCVGTLFEQFTTAYEFLTSKLSYSWHFEGPKRIDTLEIPPIAIREILLNAIIHRNYHHQAPTKVAVWADRVEIFSPGAFPGPIDPHNLRAGRTYLRNSNICRVFREAGYIEKLGSGFIVTLDSYLAAKLPAPRVFDGGDYVKCILPRQVAQQRVSLPKLDEQVLSLFDSEAELQLKDITKVLGVSRSTVSRVLKRLVDLGKLERAGRTRAVTYHLPQKPTD